MKVFLLKSLHIFGLWYSVFKPSCWCNCNRDNSRFCQKKIIDVWKGPEYAFALWRIKKIIIDNKQIAHISGANNLILSQWRINWLNHNFSIINLLSKIYLRLIFLTFWLPLICLSAEQLISEAAPHNELTFHVCLKNFLFLAFTHSQYTWPSCMLKDSNNCSFWFLIIFPFLFILVLSNLQ